MRKYDHLERYREDAVYGIDIGDCLIFPKLDGTNARVSIDDNLHLVIGSRNRIISPIADNAGFAAWCYTNRLDLARATFNLGTNEVVFHGEWLVPHTLKTYRDDVWRRFYVFDVYDVQLGRYLDYDCYARQLTDAALDVIEPLARVTNPTQDQLLALLDSNTYLIRDGCGPGEGIVIKNYSWTNSRGDQPWAKMVRTEFKDKHRSTMGAPTLGEKFQAEAAIADFCVTPTLVAKERARIEIGHAPRHVVIPRLLQTVFHVVVTEELWPALKKHKFPVVDFRRLRRFVEARTKEYAEDLF